MTEQQLGSIASVQTHRHEGATRGRKQKRGIITAVDHSYLPAASQTWLSTLPCYPVWRDKQSWLPARKGPEVGSEPGHGGIEGPQTETRLCSCPLTPVLWESWERMFTWPCQVPSSLAVIYCSLSLLSSTALSFPPLLAVTALIYNLKAPAPFFKLPLPPRLCRKLYPAFISIIAN